MTATMTAAEYRATAWNPSEAEFQAEVLSAAHQLGWMSFHDYDSRRSDAGYPDLTLLRGDTVIFWELKTRRGKIRPAQLQWIEGLGRVGGRVIAGIVRPGDWDQIITVLTTGRMVDCDDNATRCATSCPDDQ